MWVEGLVISLNIGAARIGEGRGRRGGEREWDSGGLAKDRGMGRGDQGGGTVPRGDPHGDKEKGERPAEKKDVLL